MCKYLCLIFILSGCLLSAQSKPHILSSWELNPMMMVEFAYVTPYKVNDTIEIFCRDSVNELQSQWKNREEVHNIEYDLGFKPNGKLYFFKLNKQLISGSWKKAGKYIWLEDNILQLKFNCRWLKNGLITFKTIGGLSHMANWVVVETNIIDSRDF